MRHTSFESFRSLAARRPAVVPVVTELATDTLTPVTAYAAVARGPFGFLLESLVGGERWARYSFIGTEPRETFRYMDGRVERWSGPSAWQDTGPAHDPLAHIGAHLRSTRIETVPGMPRFLGGAVGYLGFDVVRAFERLPARPPRTVACPDAIFMITDSVVVLDNAFARVLIVTNVHVDHDENVRSGFDRAIARNTELVERLMHPPTLPPIPLDTDHALHASSSCSRTTFEAGVRRIKEYIRAGDAFQVVLSRRLTVPCTSPAFAVYRCLRMLNPAPYLYHLHMNDLAVTGSSPEVLARVEDGNVTVRPIAGTRPRGATPDEDTSLAAELLADAKELAEHTMLVDLGRNDVGRVAQYGSVRVTESQSIERYSHVQHIVSQVDGRLRSDLDAIDALRACFPAGTVSGAPKVRAMEIIDELEPTSRGPYAGAVGYIGWGAKAMDTAIAIRTAVLTDGEAHVQAGAGIVADSDPSLEFEETEHKARAVIKALELAASVSLAKP